MTQPTLLACLLRWFPGVVLALMLAPAPVDAQTQVRVTGDHVTVWQRGFSTVATVASTGDVFEVVRQVGTWYEVVVPTPPGQPLLTGYIAASRVEPIGAGTPATAGGPAPRPSPRAAQPPSGSQAPGTSSRAPAAQRPAASPPSSVRLVAQAGYGWFNASQSFEAVTGSGGGPWFGGGLRYDSTRHYFIEGTLEWYQATGERVFVLDDVVYPLGIEDKVSIAPLMFSGGYSMRTRRMTTYVGGGVGAYFLRETSDFTDESEKVEETSAAYRALGGVLWNVGRYVAAGVEVQYSTVPDGLSGGAAAAFEESNLGGFQINAKFLFGR